MCSGASATCQLSKWAMLEVDSAPVKLPPADAMVYKTCHSNKAPGKLQEKKKRLLLRPPSHALIPPISVIREHRAELSATLQSFPPANSRNIYSVSSMGNHKGFPEERMLMLRFQMSRRYQGVNSKIKKKSLTCLNQRTPGWENEKLKKPKLSRMAEARGGERGAVA